MPHIGFASTSIIPSQPALLMGQMHARIARSAMDELTLNAMAIDGGPEGDAAILMSCDLGMVSESLLASARALLSRQLPEFPPQNLVTSATHTHTSLAYDPGGYVHPGGDVMPLDACRAFLAERTAACAAEAWRVRAPVKVGRAYGHAVVGHNRRPSFADGSTVMYGKAARPDFVGIEGDVDHSLDMIFVWDERERLSGMVVLVPCPSQVDENLEVFSADYWYEVRCELRRRFGQTLAVLGLCGAAGDLSPHFILDAKLEAEMRARRGLSERQEIAQRLADAVERALACTRPMEGSVAVRHAMKQAMLTPRQVSKAERDTCESIRQKAIQRLDPTSWWPTLLQRVVDTYEGRCVPAPVPAELHALRLGDAVLITNPFELFVDYGKRIKSRSPAAQTLVTQLTCGRGLYLPTERAVRGGGYGAMPAVCTVGPEGGAELVEHSLVLIGQVMGTS